MPCHAGQLRFVRRCATRLPVVIPACPATTPAISAAFGLARSGTATTGCGAGRRRLWLTATCGIPFGLVGTLRAPLAGTGTRRFAARAGPGGCRFSRSAFATRLASFSRMTIRQPAAYQQAGAIGVRRKYLRCHGRDHCGTTAFATTPAFAAIARPRSEARRQRAVMRNRLAFVALVVFIVVAQQTKLNHQGGNGIGVQLFPAAATQRRRQDHIPETGAYQPAHREPDGLEHSTHLAIAALVQSDAIPAVGALAA